MIAQDPQKHSASIIRNDLEGSSPIENTIFKEKKNW